MILVLAVLIIWTQNVIVHWNDAKNYNLKVVNKYDEIEEYCLSFSEEMEMPYKCKLFLKATSNCEKYSGTDNECEFGEFYDMALRFGFDLPPKYRNGYDLKKSWWDTIVSNLLSYFRL